MYVTQTTTPSKSGQPYICTLLRESYREGDRVKNRTLANLSHCKPEEIAACEPYLKRQLAVIRPELIVTLGKFAAQALLRDQSPISRLRGHWREYEGIALMPTYHPAFLLRNPAAKREVWEDMKLVMARLSR